jgi:quercetin dioxygenase-like cupin family protein
MAPPEYYAPDQQLTAIHKRYIRVIPSSLNGTRSPAMIGRKKDEYKMRERDQMKQNIYIAIALVALVGWAGQHYIVSAHSMAHGNAFTPDTIQWGPPPPFVAPGAQFAVIEGDPTASSGNYTVRLKMPAGYRIAPHWHPLRENVTVISGTFKVGMGDTFDTNKMGTFPAGSFAFLDPDMHHYAMAASDVVVQIHGTAPVQFNYINPQDDPSKK